MILIIKHEAIEGAGTLGYFFSATHWDVKTVELWSGEGLPSLDECEGIVSLGGPMNVYEEEKHPFLTLENEFLKGAMGREIPMIGICLGAQLLAKCMGAEVRRAKREEFGWCALTLTEEAARDPLFKKIQGPLETFQWHEDTFNLPAGARLLVTSQRGCKNQAIRIGKRAWGLQFHPELTSQIIEDWVDYYKADIDKDDLLSGYQKRKAVYEGQAARLCHNFADAITARENCGVA